MALEVGDVTKVDPPPPPVRPDPEVTEPVITESPEPTTSPSTDVASTDPPTPIIDDIRAIQQADPSLADGGLVPSVAQLSIPFIPPGLTEKQAQALRDSNIRILDEEIGQRAQMKADLDRRDREFEARMESANRAIGFEGSHLQPWNAEREMASRKHNLWEEFGSSGFLVAMMASAFTTMPMVSALNGGAAAMNAINQGDIDGYNTAFDAWKQNTELTLKRMKIEQDEFNNIDKLRTSNYARWKEDLGLMLDKYGDERKKAMLDAGLDPDILKAYEALENLRGKIANNYQAQIENKAVFDGVQHELKENPKQSWFDAYAKTIEKLNRAKNSGKWSGSDAAVWERAVEKCGGDIDCQVEFVKKYKRESKGETAASIKKESQDKIRDTINREHQKEIAEGTWTLGDTEIELEKREGAAKKAQDTGSQNVAKAIKAELVDALGHDLSPTLESSIDAAYQAKGVNRQRVIDTLNEVIDRIVADKAAGKPIDDAEAAKRIHEAIQTASQSAARSAATAFQQKFTQEYVAKHGVQPSANQTARASFLFTTALSAARAYGTREAAINSSIEEVKDIAPKALEARKKEGGGNITLFNSWKQVSEAARGVKGYGQLQVYTAGLLTAYANTLQRGGHTTDNARLQAMSLLSTSYSYATYAERVNTMRDEMNIIQRAVKRAEAEGANINVDEDEDKPKSDPGGYR